MDRDLGWLPVKAPIGTRTLDGDREPIAATWHPPLKLIQGGGRNGVLRLSPTDERANVDLEVTLPYYC